VGPAALMIGSHTRPVASRRGRFSVRPRLRGGGRGREYPDSRYVPRTRLDWRAAEDHDHASEAPAGGVAWVRLLGLVGVGCVCCCIN
jgi:hypothetical protein